MKLMYLLATFAVVLVMMASCTRQSVTGYTLTAAIDGIPDGSHVQLFPVTSVTWNGWMRKNSPPPTTEKKS